MIILTLALILILGIAFLQMKQGLLSALTMTVCTVLAGVLAMVTYKQAALATGLYDKMNPLLVDAGFLGLLFLVPLFTLRTITDKFVSEDIYFNTVIDRICGAICGIITGITMIGILLVITQLLPVPVSILGYKPYNDKLQRSASLAPFYPDDFVIGLGGMISSNWGGDDEETFSKEDILRTGFINRNLAGLPGRRDAGKKALQVLGVYKLKETKKFNVPSNLDKPDSMTQVLVVRVELNPKESIDEDDWWRLPATQFRMKCNNGKFYYPVGYFFYNQKKRWELVDDPTVQLAVQRPIEEIKGQGLVIDWVYRIPSKISPSGSQAILPESITFRQVSTVDVIAKKIKLFPRGTSKIRQTALQADTEDAKKKRRRERKRKRRRNR